MRLFRRKKRKDEEEDDLEEGESKPKKRKNKPESERKKKPPKPWGKKERILVLVIIIFTAGTSSVLALSARSWKLPGIPRLKAPKLPDFSFISDETIVVEGNRQNTDKSSRIENEFVKLTQDLSGVYGFYVTHLSDGYAFGVNENEIFEPASLNKLPVMLAAYRQSEDDEFDLDGKYILKNSDKIQGSGSLSGSPEGTVLTYRELLSLMGKQSDNTAFGIVRDALGDEIINNTITEIGMVSTSIAENETTPKDIGIYFERLYRSGLISEESKEEILNNLTDTVYESWITEGIPGDIRVAHKFGREIHVVNDAGIVYTENPYIIVILSKGVVEQEADEVIPKISRMIYETEVE